MAKPKYPPRWGSANANWRGGGPGQCHRCGGPLWIKPSRKDRPRHFCGEMCRNAWMSETLTLERSSNWKGGKVDLVCVVCGKGFSVQRAERARRGTKCCSRECFYKTQQNQIEKTCEFCGSTFTVAAFRVNSARFCSGRCKKVSQIKERTELDVAKRRLDRRIGGLIRYSLRERKQSIRWERLVGYTLADLMTHLQALFEPGMSWLNIAEWHVDHRLPRSSFTYSSYHDEQFKRCWALSNLQPLWAIDNLRKHARLDWRRAA